MKESYQQAVLSLINQGVHPDKVLSGLELTLKKHGHSALFPSILRGVLRVIEAKPAATAVVTVAKAEDLATYRQAIDASLKQLNAEGEVNETIDDSIVGGYIVSANNQMLDKSFKHQLVSLYRNLTH